MKRSGPLKRRTPIKQRSDKRRDLYEREGGRRDVVEAMLRERPDCEAGEDIAAFKRDMGGWHECQRRSSDVHELVPRSGGGSILDADNLLAVCRLCHGWIHDNPSDARLLGLLVSRYGAA